METKLVGSLLVALALGASSLAAQAPGPRTFKGLELSIEGVERASSAGLSDCPPGANTQRAMSGPGEEFAIVRVHVNVLPEFRPAPIGSPVLEDTDGNTYRTAAFFMGGQRGAEFTCAFPFRVPEGTALRSLQLDTISLSLPAAGSGGREGTPQG